MTRFVRLTVSQFGVIDAAEVELGPGLNVLYGPNDLGKSTLGDALRAALLLPHKSTHSERFVSWYGGGEPRVVLAFTGETSDVWEVDKRFGPRGASTLRWSRGGHDFDEKAAGRDVDRRVRELLKWGLPEPGGAGASRGAGASYLATALLSTQAGVSAVLTEGIARDASSDGRERIAEAFAAASEDPLFAEVRARAKLRRDEAYTEGGKQRHAADSVLRKATDAVSERARAFDEWSRRVQQAEGIEEEVARLHSEQDRAVAEALARRGEVEGADELIARARRRADAAAAADVAAQRLLQACALRDEVERLERELVDADASLASVAEGAARAREAERALLERPELDSVWLRDGYDADRTAAAQARVDAAALGEAASRRLEAIAAARALMTEATAREREAEAADGAAAEESERVDRARGELDGARREQDWCATLSRARALQLARAEAERLAALQRRGASLAAAVTDADASAAAVRAERAAILAPTRERLKALRELERELFAARAALAVGLTLELEPARELELELSVDGAAPRGERVSTRWSVDAASELVLTVAGLGRARIVGGRADAREVEASLILRWKNEAVPVLASAGVADLQALDGIMDRAAWLDGEIVRIESVRDAARAAWSSWSDPTVEAARARDAITRLEVELGQDAARALAQVESLGPEALAGRVAAAIERERAARDRAAGAELATLTERAAQARQRATDAARLAQQAVSALEGDVDEAERCARAQLSESEVAALAAARALSALDEERARAEAGRDEVRARAADERAAAVRAREAAESEHAALGARIAALRARAALLGEQRAAVDLGTLKSEASALADALAGLPVVEAPGEGARRALGESLARAEARRTEAEAALQRARGALEQVGGHVARDRLADAATALAVAKRHLEALERDYAAWKLLFDTLKDAGAKQASDLGGALAPVVGEAFAELTQRRYASVTIGGALESAGVVVGEEARDPERLSVGTREQLSTVLRLCLAERLGAPMLLDDQLVQSDGARMARLAALIREKAAVTQIVVLTCRPTDYLDATALPDDGVMARDSADGAVRAIDLSRVIRSSRRRV